MAFRVLIPEKWHKCQKLGMFNKIKLLACFIEIHVYAFLIILICRLQNEFNWTLQSPCEFLFSICLPLSLCSLLLLSCFLLGRILSDSLWLDRSANFCLMLLTYFLCGFIVEPAIHSHNLRAKKKSGNNICWLSGDYALCIKSRWCGKWGKYVKTFRKKLGNLRSLCCNIFTPLPLRTAHLGWVIAQNEELPGFY